jgi:hypothetical protein
MWEFPLAITIVVVGFGFSIRQQLHFLLSPRTEVTGMISRVEWFFAPDEDGGKWFVRCMVEYEVHGRLYQLSITRREQPPLGETVTLTYPAHRPDEAIEGNRQTAVERQILAIGLSLLVLLVLILFRANQPSPQ